MASQDKVAFITGANKGIGLETARGLGELGIAVVIGSRDEAKGRAAAEKLRAEGIEKRRGRPVRRHQAGGSPGDRPAPGGALRQARHPGEQRGRHAGGGRLRRARRVQHDVHGDARRPPADVRDELLRRRRPHAGAPAADPQVPGRADRQPVEHPRVAHAALRPEVAHLRHEGVRLRRVEDGARTPSPSTWPTSCAGRRSR